MYSKNSCQRAALLADLDSICIGPEDTFYKGTAQNLKYFLILNPGPAEPIYALTLQTV